MSAYVNHAQIRSWNQPVLSNEGKVSCSGKQRGPLLGLELMTDRHRPTTSQTSYPLRHCFIIFCTVPNRFKKCQNASFRDIVFKILAYYLTPPYKHQVLDPPLVKPSWSRLEYQLLPRKSWKYVLPGIHVPLRTMEF